MIVPGEASRRERRGGARINVANTARPKREYITNPQAVYDQFAGKGGDLNQFMSCVGVSKGKLKEQLAEVTKKKGRQLQSELRQVIGDNSEYRDTESRFERTKS